MSAAKFLGYSRGEFVYKKTNDKYNINALGYDWSNHINYLQNLVGEEKVKVLFQEELALSEEKFYARIGCVLGVKINAVKKRERVNRGVSALGLNCARIVRIFFNSVDRFIGTFVESGSVIGKFNWKLSKAIVRKVFRNGVDRLLFIDWDLVGKKRRIILMKYYQNMNKGLLPYFPDEDIKNKYF